MPTRTPTRCSGTPAVPVLLAPTSATPVPTRQPVLDWVDVPCTTRYEVVVKNGSPSGTTADSKNNLTVSQYTTKLLTRNKTYYWHVRACNAKGCGKWSVWWRFKVSATAAYQWRRDEWWRELARAVAQALK